MLNVKKDFSIFSTNKNLVYLDNAATTQKPKSVIDAVNKYLTTINANIHRGAYEIADASQELYDKSKEAVATFINGRPEEIIYTFNSTYAFNMIVRSLRWSGYIKAGDTILLSISEHHANEVPWLILKEKYNITIKYIKLTDEYEIDLEDFKKQYTPDVKIVSIVHVSNVTGTITNIHAIKSLLREDTIFIVDGSQSVQHFSIDVQDLGCDFFIFTGHKIMALTGIGVLWGKKNILENLKPMRGGGDMIKEVSEQSYTYAPLPNKFEPGTPNIIGAVSLLAALEYINKIGGIAAIQSYENHLTTYTLTKFIKLQEKYPNTFKLIGKKTSDKKSGLFSFVLLNGISPKTVGEIMAEHNICIRTGGLCAHPLMKKLGLTYGVCRMSLYIYNDENDIDAFFTVLKKIIHLGQKGNEKSNDTELCE